MPTKYNPSDFDNELEYVEAELGFELIKTEYEVDYELNKEGKLIRLTIVGKEISNIDFISNLTSLTDLNLSSNQIQDVKPLSAFTSLTNLYLSSNQIQDIQVLSKLTSLTQLSLNSNQIQDIKPLSALISLTNLYLSDNQIQDVQALSSLTSLTNLDLDYNLIDDISPLSNLTSLENLYLTSNNFTNFEVFTNLSSLKTLFLYRNQISDLNFILNLTNLVELHLSNNNIDDISALSKLTSLKVLTIENNPIENVPETILKSSGKEIVRWLQENNKEEEKVLLKDVKILLLGNTNIGKSNLLFLWQQRYRKISRRKRYPKKSISTHGLVYIEMQKTKKAPLLHIWDFGGQEYFHATHQLFFSPDALHVLLWSKNMRDTRVAGEEVFKLDYWLRCSEQLSKGESPIEMVLVENRIDHQDEKKRLEYYTHFPEKKYLEKFHIYSPHEKTDTDKPPFMLNACSVSLKYKKRLEGMFELLEERVEMSYKKNVYPPIYAEIRNTLVASTKPVWTLSEYKKKFKEKDGVILQTLHSAGCLLYFHQQLPNKVFTKPNVLLELIYDKILNPNLKKSQGKLTDELNNAANTNKLGLKIKDLESLLSAFKLIFQTKEGDWFAPQYLPEESPVWLQLLKEYTFGIANIIVSTDQYLMNSILLDIFSEYAGVIKKDDSYLFWQKGLVIEKDGQLLLIEYDRKQMRLLLYGDQQEKNQQLQKEVVDFIIRIIHKDEKPKYKLESIGEEVNRIGFKNFELTSKGKDGFSKNISWNSDKVNIGVSVDGNYYVNIHDLYENVKNKIYTIKAFHYDDETSFKAFSVFQFNKYLDEKDQGILKKVTISYSKDDLKLVNEFIKNLVPLHDDGLIENPWYCSQLEAGTEWNKEIQEQFKQADIIFFMVSPNFLATKYIKEHEIKTAIARRQQEIENKVMPSKQVKIIPIILDFCRWQRKDAKYNLGTYTALPYTAKPVVDFKNRNMAWYIIEEAIRTAIEKDNDPDFDTNLKKDVKKIYERIMERRVDDDNVDTE